MSYTQCRNQDECEALVTKQGHAFVSDDFRIYEKIQFWDNAVVYELSSEEILVLLNLKSNIEMLGENDLEMSFLQVVESAEQLKADYERVRQLLRKRK